MDNNKKIRLKFWSILLFSILLIIVVFLLALMIGRYNISISILLDIIKGNTNFHPMETSIIINLRIPRTIIALLVGIALSLSGLVYQETFQNKLVSPDILGVSSGASVGVALGLLLGLPVFSVSITGFVFGFCTMLLTLFIAKLFQNKTPTILLLAGIIVSGFMSAGLSIIKSIANTETILPAITFWLLGSFSNAKMGDVWVLMPIVVLGSFILLLIRWKINIVALGEEEAITKGINYKLYRIIIIAVATFLTAGSVAFSGVIGWIGLIIPHIVRLIVGRNTKYTIPLAITFGAIFMMVTDVLARTISDSEIPLSAITGFLGVPIFVLVLALRKNEVNEHN